MGFANVQYSCGKDLAWFTLFNSMMLSSLFSLNFGHCTSYKWDKSMLSSWRYFNYNNITLCYQVTFKQLKKGQVWYHASIYLCVWDSIQLVVDCCSYKFTLRLLWTWHNLRPPNPKRFILNKGHSHAKRFIKTIVTVHLFYMKTVIKSNWT